MIGAIIVEYNPLHNGHLYHIAESRRLMNKMSPNEDNYLVAIMSGNFCQRGEVSVLNKFTRTKHALQSGVDMVLELPSVFATSSAEYFSNGAMQIASKINGLGLICFGSESGDMSALSKVCDLINTPDYDKHIKEHLRSGLSYPASSALSLQKLGVTDDSLLNMPNNTLAIEYIKQARVYGIENILVTIKRQGGGYNDSSLSANYSSATAIRHHMNANNLDSIMSQVPRCVFDDLAKSSIDYSKLYGIIAIRAKLATSVYEDNEGVINRIKRGVEIVDSYTELIDYAHTKRYTKSKIKRILIHLALGHNAIDISRPIDMIKVLGVRENCKQLLSIIYHGKDSYYLDMDTATNEIYNIVSNDKILTDKMLII